MIDGITVLKTVTINTNEYGGYIVGTILFGISALIFLVISIHLVSKSRHYYKTLIIMLFCFFAIFTCLSIFMLSCYLNPISWKEYKVKISSSVTYKDFTSKYHVVSQNGEIYTIVDNVNK